MRFLWDFRVISMIYGISVRFLWDFHVISMIFLWDFCEIPMGFPCYFYGDFHVISVISMIFLWDFCEIPMEFPCYVYDLSMGFL